MAINGEFLLMEPRWGNDRVFKMLVADEALCGPRVGGMLTSERFTRMCAVSAQIFSPIVWWLKRRADRSRAQIEQQSARVDPMSSEFLALRSGNFRIDGRRLRCVEISRKPTLWTGRQDSGSVTFHYLDGSKKRYILIDWQDPERVRDLLSTPGWEINLKG